MKKLFLIILAVSSSLQASNQMSKGCTKDESVKVESNLQKHEQE